MSDQSVQILTLVEGCCNNDRNAQRELYQFLFGYAMKICYRYTSHQHEAEELTNESFVKLFNAEFEVFYIGKNKKDVDKNTLASLSLDHRLVSLNPKFHLVEDEDIMLGVTSIAKKHDIDLLIIVPKKHGPFHKSQARDFIFYSDVPVMAIHENDLEEKS